MNQPALTKRKHHITLATVFTAAGVLYALISLVNHYFFKTYTLDLGLYTHAMYDYAHLRVDDCSMFLDNPQSILAAHFDLYLLLLSPLVYLFGSYTLLIVQIVAVLLGGWGVYKLIALYSDDRAMPLLAVVAFFLSFGIIHAMSYDFHSNVLTTMILPWLLYFFKKRKFGLATLFVLLFVIGKENMSLWLFFIAIGLMWDYRKDKKSLYYLLGFSVFALAYFLIVNLLILPKLGGSGISRYDYLGDNYVEIGKNLVTHPAETIRILFVNTSGMPKYDGVKLEFYNCLLASGLLLTLLKPNFLLMLVPLIAQKMLSGDTNFWGVSFHYSVEFVPVLVISSFLVILKLKRRVWRLTLAVALCVSIVATTFYTIGVPRSLVFLDQLCVYQSRHYEQKKFDADYTRQLMATIPDDASVCASSMLVPHLALRNEIYDYDCRKESTNADYYFVAIRQGWLCTWDDVVALYRLWDYDLLATDGYVFLFRKRQLD